MTPVYPDYFSPQETLPRPQLLELQEARLMATLEYNYQASPIFNSLCRKAGVKPADINSLEDFAEKIPLFDKDDIRAYRDRHNDPCGGLIRLDDPRLTTLLSTSGTTGDPTPMPMRHRYSSDEAYVRTFWHMGGRPGDYLVMPVFTFRGGAANGISCQKEAGLTPIYFNHDPAELPRIIEAIKRYRPTVFGLISAPLLLGLEKHLEKTGENARELFSCFKGFIHGGEQPSPRMKALTQAWGMTMYETCAAGDVVSATTCRAHDGFHVWEDLAYAECLDPVTDQPVADGQMGELVVTNINDPLLAMVRFRTDDLVTVNREPCACGRTHMRFHIHGRKSDQTVVCGKAILPRDIRLVVEEQRETAAGLYQIIKTASEMDTLAVRVGYNPDKLGGSTTQLIGALEEALRAALDVPVRVELTLDDELLKLGPPHKIPRVTKQ
jgi:phenylacetate-CoA ligase